MQDRIKMRKKKRKRTMMITTTRKNLHSFDEIVTYQLEMTSNLQEKLKIPEYSF